MDPKIYLHLYLQQVRDVLVWKLDGLSEYDARRPLTPTGTNLLGLVKHLTGNGFGYFGEVFDRPAHTGEWLVDRTQSEDFLARPEETREDIIAQYKRSWEHADATIAALDLDSPGKVPHFPEGWWNALTRICRTRRTNSPASSVQGHFAQGPHTSAGLCHQLNTNFFPLFARTHNPNSPEAHSRSA
ncbi:DinB family protein [Amycolatopsis sp. NPDC051061]|uniref:DinB family protein n=1 Tax=Amycolatopsis sp. NPDC051061 TaxID=3155042 RepID=UPI00342B9E25